MPQFFQSKFRFVALIVLLLFNETPRLQSISVLFNYNETSSITFSSDKSYQQICTYDNFKLIRPYIVKQLYDARRELSSSSHQLGIDSTSSLFKLKHNDSSIDNIWSILTDYNNLSTHIPNLIQSYLINVPNDPNK